MLLYIHQVRNLKFTLRGGVHDDASKAVLINKLEVTLHHMLNINMLS
jgi:hypothetical protein